MEKFFVLVLLCAGIMISGCATTGSSRQVLEQRVNTLESDLRSEKEANMQARSSVQYLQDALAAQKEEQAALKAEFEKTQKRLESLETPVKFDPKTLDGKEIQKALKNAGYYEGEIDGVIGSKTKEAIKKFQEANKLTADGVVGSKTWSLLAKHLESEAK